MTVPTIDVSTVRTPGWWLARLDMKLAARRYRYDKLERYYTGDHPLPEGDERCREMFKRFQRKARTNYMRLVVDSRRKRLRVVGFRTGAAQTDDADKLAWKIWQANRLDADSGMVHETALKLCDAYVMVGPPETLGGMPVITPEDPRQVIVEADPVNRRQIRAGLKTWVDDVDRARYGVVYLPGSVHYFKAPLSSTQQRQIATRVGDQDWDHVTWGEASQWQVWDTEGDAGVGDNPLGEVPIVRFVNAPNLYGEGFGAFEDVIDIQDRINDTVLNRLVIAKMQAYRQRYVTGIATEDADGNDLELPFVPGVDLLWAVEATDVHFGDFAQSDLGPLLEAVKEDVNAIVSLTGLPPHYVQAGLVNASADAIVAAQDQLVAEVKDAASGFGESWEQVERLSFAYLGRAADIGDDAEVQWADPERRSQAQLADAATKKSSAGVPWKQRMIDLGYTPPEIERMATERQQDLELEAKYAIAATTKVQ